MYQTEEFDPLDYDIYHLGVSGGKDSTAALLWLVYESGWPLSRLRVTFCDTNNEDALTYAYLAMLAERVYPIEYVFPQRDFWELAQKKKRFPARKARFCTQHLKIIPSMQHIERLKERGRILLMSGVRRDEGRATNDRGDLEQFDHDDTYGCDKFLPIYELDISEVWGLHQRHLDTADVLSLLEHDEQMSLGTKIELSEKMLEHGVPRNPLYDMGARRVGCFPCIFSAKREIRAMAKYRPARIEFIDDMEHSVTNPYNADNPFSSFFARDTVPEWCRTRPIVTSRGEEMNVASIHDVVTWSHTSWGAKQFEMDFRAFPEENMICDMRGMCE